MSEFLSNDLSNMPATFDPEKAPAFKYLSLPKSLHEKDVHIFSLPQQATECSLGWSAPARNPRNMA